MTIQDAASRTGAARTGLVTAACAVPPSSLRILVVHEDGAAGRRAMRAVSRLKGQAGERLEFRPEFMRFDLLQFDSLREKATWDAIESDLIVVSTRGSSDIPAPVDDWLRGCLALRGGTSTALIGLFGPGDAWSVSIQDDCGIQSARGRNEAAFDIDLGVGREAVLEASA